MRFAKTSGWLLILLLIVSALVAPASQLAQTDAEKRINDLMSVNDAKRTGERNGYSRNMTATSLSITA